MASTVTIFFTGLCYLVNQGPSKEVNVIMPNASVPRIAVNPHSGGHSAAIPGHYVYVRYRLDQVSPCGGTDTVPDIIFERNGIRYGAYIVRGEQIAVATNLDGNQPLSFNSTTSSPSNPPKRTDRLRFDTYVAHLTKDVSASATKVDAKHLKPTSGVDVAGRLDIKAGNLAAAFANPDQVWRFKPDAKKPATDFNLAQLVAWDMQVVTESVTLNFSPFDGRSPKPHCLTLDVKATSGIDLEIGNTPIEDLVMPGSLHDPDHHYEIHYDLLKGGPPAKRAIPHMRSGAPHGANCPPVQGDMP